MKLDDSHASMVEYEIEPSIAKAITLPVKTEDGKDTGIAVYVTSSRFSRPVGDAKLQAIAAEMVRLINQPQ
jgi:hypothetical protein